MPKTEMQQSRGLHMLQKNTFMLHIYIYNSLLKYLAHYRDNDFFTVKILMKHKGVISLNLILIFQEILLFWNNPQ